MAEPRLAISADQLAAICQRRAVKRLALFGSVLRDDFGPDSDVDVLVEFDPANVAGKQIFRLVDDLSALFGGRKVDLVEEQFLSGRLRSYVLAQAEVLYAA